MATYGVSTFGKVIVIEEESGEQFSMLRVGFMFATIMIGFTNIALVTKCFSKTAHAKKIQHYFSDGSSPWAIYLIYVIHTLVHTFHYVDNIARPVSYFEPKYLYQKYLFSTMEDTFFFNIPLTICGVLFMRNLFLHRGYVEYTYLTAYICSSLMTIMHYRIESPVNYAPTVNFSIAGEGVVVLVFILASLTIKQQPGNKYYKLTIILFPTVLVTLLIFTNMGAISALAALGLFSIVCIKVLSDQEWELIR